MFDAAGKSHGFATSAEMLWQMAFAWARCEVADYSDVLKVTGSEAIR
jgi:hypothetical protein